MNASLPQQPPNGSVTLDVVQAIAEYKGTDPTDLNPPLHSAIDTEALNKVFAPTKEGPRRGRITFTYDEITVVVESDGTVRIEPQEMEPD